MWPTRPDMSRDECKKCLRCLELEAYSSMVSVLRAQGSFTAEKRKLLQELAKVLHISNERHRAEIRRAVTDEKLSAIAEQLSGSNTSTDWAIEGRRTIPLLPRLDARNVFTSLANSLSLATSIANAKKATVAQKCSTNVKAEPEPILKTLKEQELSPNTTTTQAEVYSKSKKRRRSPSEIRDISSTPIQSFDSDIAEDTVSPFCRTRLQSPTPLPIPLPNKVLIVSTCSTPIETKNNIIINTTAEINSIDAPSSHRHISNQPSGSGNPRPNITVAGKTIIQQNNGSSQIPAQKSRPITMVATTHVTTSVASKVQSKIATPRTTISQMPTVTITSDTDSISTAENSVQLNISAVETTDNDSEKKSMKLVPLSGSVTKIIKPSSSVNPVCTRRITTTAHQSGWLPTGTKSIPSQTCTRVMTVNTGSISSSGPGPPQIRPATAVLACKKNSAVKGSNQNSKMGITLDSNKTVNIVTNPGAKLASKANVIVLQKGTARGVTLSHAGKEVLGKVIMGGKNLCLANQQTNSSIALLPHRPLANGERNLTTTSSPSNPSQPESTRTNTKSGNMIVFDLRQDSLEKSRVLSEILEASGVFNSDAKIAALNSNAHSLIKEQSNDTSSQNCLVTKSPHDNAGAIISFVMESKEHRGPVSECITQAGEDEDLQKMDPVTESMPVETEEHTIDNSECVIEMQEILGPQTGLYSCRSPDDAINNIHPDESLCDTEIDMFRTALTSADINLESFPYISDNDSGNGLDDMRNKYLSIDQINDLYEGHQSISDKSNS